MAKQHLIVKRHGHIEEYDKRKVYGSVYAAALNAHLGEQKAEKKAEKVSKNVTKHVKKQKEVDSDDIRDLIIDELGGEEDDVAYLYKHHLDIN